MILVCIVVLWAMVIALAAWVGALTARVEKLEEGRGDG